jgi:formate-dependent nitrite reductase cytochrome c552 subunit
MPNPPDTDYFIYIYVATCEACHCPHVEATIADKVPRDEIERNGIEWTCRNCNSYQSTALYRAAVDARWLWVKEGKCSERHKTGNVSPMN